ncbi:MAG: methyltransferase domain-containing protein [Rickettsiaceae bacterium]|nr:methyltransferase domain-containing protein [Rickettsiaceae bacterium]
MKFLYSTLLGLFIIFSGLYLWNNKSKVKTYVSNLTFNAQINSEIFANKDIEPKLDESQMLMSQIATESQFSTPLYKKWCDEIKENPKYHRKQWEFVYILQALNERGMISKGKKGVGFGVGEEPMPAIFAKNGVEVLATDLNQEDAKAAGWVDTAQHLSSKEILNKKQIAPQDLFDSLVSIRDLDMNAIPEDIKDYDFTWSSCALEHLGSIENGLKFIENSLKTLKPGGIAVHTTEYNLTSNEDTLSTGGTVIFRKKDIQDLVKRLTDNGHEVYVNYNPGNGKLDKHIDLPPYKHDDHIKLQLNKYVTTSIGLIIRKKF